MKFKLIYWWLLVLLLTTKYVYGGMLATVSPMSLTFTAEEKVKAVYISNESSVEQAYQVDIVRWQRDNNYKDIYSATSNFVISPPIFKLKPKQKQTIRIAFERGNTSDIELAYRLYIKQLPINKSYARTSRYSLMKNQITFMMGWAIPVIVEPQHITKKILWQATLLPDKKIRLNIIDNGNISFLVGDLKLYTPNGQQLKLIKRDALRIFPKQKTSWVFALPPGHSAPKEISMETKNENESIKKLLNLQ